MRVSADQIASLRAFLEGDFDQHKRLNSQLDHGSNVGLSMLFNAAFFEAADRKFPKGTTGTDIIQFVGDIRVRYEGMIDKVDPHVAERLLRAVRTGEDIEDLDTADSLQTQFFLLYVLVADEELDEGGLDAFMADARNLADEWLAED